MPWGSWTRLEDPSLSLFSLKQFMLFMYCTYVLKWIMVVSSSVIFINTRSFDTLENRTFPGPQCAGLTNIHRTGLKTIQSFCCLNEWKMKVLQLCINCKIKDGWNKIAGEKMRVNKSLEICFTENLFITLQFTTRYYRKANHGTILNLAACMPTETLKNRPDPLLTALYQERTFLTALVLCTIQAHKNVLCKKFC